MRFGTIGYIVEIVINDVVLGCRYRVYSLPCHVPLHLCRGYAQHRDPKPLALAQDCPVHSLYDARIGH